MRIVALIENTSAAEKLKAEHGLCLYVEKDGNKYLIDTGASDKFINNAKKMRIPIGEVTKILVSHNHFDHTGGIEPYLKINPDVEIYAKKAADNDFYIKQGFLRVPIGQISYLREENSDNFVLYNSFQEIDEGVFAMSNEYTDYSMYCEDKRLYMRYEGQVIRDDFLHEAFFVFFPERNREKGCVVISPCSHCGIVNILKTVRMRFPESPILSVIGGFHLMGSSTKKLCCSVDYVDKTINELKGIETGTIYTCHCTGLTGYGILKAKLGDRIQYLQTGEELTF